MIQGILLRVG